VLNNPQLSMFDDPPATGEAMSRKDHLTFRANRSQGRHGWLRLTPAYSVHLVEELVAQCGPEELVLDPFCGTGTTALVCAQAGVRCHTVDINPFLVWLTNAKCASYSASDIKAARDVLAAALNAMGQSSDHSWLPAIKDISKWWEADTLSLLSNLFVQLDHPSLAAPVRDLLKVIFCRSVIELASVSFGHQSMSFTRRTSTAALVQIAPEQRVSATFQRIAAEVLNSAKEPLPDAAIAAFTGDARTLAEVLPQTGYTRVITSPPYPNRMSYIRELRPYMYWLGYLTSGRQAGELDWQAIGGTWGCATSNLMKWQHSDCYPVPYDGFHALVATVTERSRVLGVYIDKYFHDVVEHIASLKQVLSPGAKVFYVVGNSKFYDVLLPTQDIYAAIFAAQGFGDICVTPIRKRTSKKELFEYIVSASLPD